MKELTIEQHLNNIAFALDHDSLTVSNRDKKIVVESFNHIKGLLIKKEETKEEKKFEKTDLK